MFSKIILAAWSLAGLFWWVLARGLVEAERRKKISNPKLPTRRSLSVFKPLPPLGARGIKNLEPGLESFIAQLDAESELLLGIHETDRTTTAPFLERMQRKYPEAQLKIIFRSKPDELANPKIAWQKVLASHAEGELWLWSDADIIAPPSFLRSARIEFEQSDTAMLTFPYVVRDIPSPPTLLDALFVNVEFYPGVLLLRRLEPIDFGLGAAMLFQRNDFLTRVNWQEIGSKLADDFFLGQKLRPVRIGSITLTTIPHASSWKEALLHDLRWAKTIRWNRPGGFAARILILPVLGWLGYVAWHPFHFLAWVGLLGMIQADVFFATIICWRLDCRLEFKNLLNMELWSIWRIVLWLLCWLPGSVVWVGKRWPGPRPTSV